VIKDPKKSWIHFFDKYLIDFKVEKKAKTYLKVSKEIEAKNKMEITQLEKVL